MSGLKKYQKKKLFDRLSSSLKFQEERDRLLSLIQQLSCTRITVVKAEILKEIEIQNLYLQSLEYLRDTYFFHIFSESFQNSPSQSFTDLNEDINVIMMDLKNNLPLSLQNIYFEKMEEINQNVLEQVNAPLIFGQTLTLKSYNSSINQFTSDAIMEDSNVIDDFLVESETVTFEELKDYLKGPTNNLVEHAEYFYYLPENEKSVYITQYPKEFEELERIIKIIKTQKIQTRFNSDYTISVQSPKNTPIINTGSTNTETLSVIKRANIEEKKTQALKRRNFFIELNQLYLTPNKQ